METTYKAKRISVIKRNRTEKIKDVVLFVVALPSLILLSYAAAVIGYQIIWGLI